MSAYEMGTKSCHCCFWACFQRTWPQTSPGCVPKDPHHPPQPELCWCCRGFTFEHKKHHGEERVCPGAHKAGLWAAPGHLSWFLFAVLVKAGKHQLNLLGSNSAWDKIQELCEGHPRGCSSPGATTLPGGDIQCYLHEDITVKSFPISTEGFGAESQPQQCLIPEAAVIIRANHDICMSIWDVVHPPALKHHPRIQGSPFWKPQSTVTLETAAFYIFGFLWEKNKINPLAP